MDDFSEVEFEVKMRSKDYAGAHTFSAYFVPILSILGKGGTYDLKELKKQIELVVSLNEIDKKDHLVKPKNEEAYARGKVWEYEVEWALSKLKDLGYIESNQGIRKITTKKGTELYERIRKNNNVPDIIQIQNGLKEELLSYQKSPSGQLDSELDAEEDYKGRIKFITFHQSYSYEDFVEGFRPESRGDGSLFYKINDGAFKQMCANALKAALNGVWEKEEQYEWKKVYSEYRYARDEIDWKAAPKFVIIIDEINRANISKVFGELITLIEENKRLGAEEELPLRLPYSGEEFGVPKNLYIIGTMNSTDKSIALVDIALRRRFKFERLNVKYHEDKKEDGQPIIKDLEASDFLRQLNKKICALKDADHEIGHSYFMKIGENDEEDNKITLEDVFADRIFPLIEEYFNNDWGALATILGEDAIKMDGATKKIEYEDGKSAKSDEDAYGMKLKAIRNPDGTINDDLFNKILQNNLPKKPEAKKQP